MIREMQWKNLDRTNRELALGLERLRKVFATGEIQEIRQAEIAYLQALQFVYDAAQEAVTDRNRGLRK